MPAELINLPHLYSHLDCLYVREVSETGDDSIFAKIATVAVLITQRLTNDTIFVRNLC